MAVCVCRHSGWAVVEPFLRKGLTAQIVGEAMAKNWLQMGVPSQVTSDQGPQFAGAWWQTMCARLGIRGVYSQAYHHQANGRAEVQGKIFKTIIKKIN